MSRYLVRTESVHPESNVESHVRLNVFWRALKCFSPETVKPHPSEIHVPSQCATLSQAVHRASANKNVHTIFINPGFYSMETETIFISTSNLTIKGAGQDSTCLYGKGYHGKIQISPLCQNITVEGLHLCCQGSGNGIEIMDKSSVLLNNVKISGGGIGVYARKDSNVVIRNSVISGNASPGVYVEDAGTECKIYDSSIVFNDSNGCYANRNGRIVLHNCLLEKNKDSDDEVQENGVIIRNR